jgi:nucleotide-binding universal stress UspA family protein
MLILIPIDGSEASLDAVHHALRLGDNGLAAHFVLVNVQEPPHLYEVVMAPDPAALADASLGAGEYALAPACALLDKAAVRYETEIVAGEPGHELVDAAERHECDAILMGSQGTGLLGGARLGSVCQWVLLHAGVPVTIVRHAEPESESESELESQAA